MIPFSWRWFVVLVGGLSLGLVGVGLSGVELSMGQPARMVDHSASPSTQQLAQQPSQLDASSPVASPPTIESPVAQSPIAESMPPTPSPLALANTRFGFKLFAQLQLAQLQQDGGENISLSPASVLIALSMLYNGATGNTQQEMAQTLEIAGMSLAELNQANADLAAALENADPEVQLAIANSLWSREDFIVKPEFLQSSQKFYQAKVASLDFRQPDAPAQINRWVSQNTAGKIPQIVEQIDPEQVMFLINAIYFKGTWTTPFNPEQTQEAPFYGSDGSPKQQPMMEQQGNYSYFETEQFQAVSLPYGNGRFSMDLFLPRPESNLRAFQQTLTAENWENWMGQFASRPGSLQLPKFKLEYETSLNSTLSALGMRSAFTAGQAEFAALSDQETVISEVKHKTFLEVNEVGTEAAAATSIGITTTSINLTPPFQMQINRPFFYAIREHQTGTLLFMGSVTNLE